MSTRSNQMIDMTLTIWVLLFVSSQHIIKVAIGWSHPHLVQRTGQAFAIRFGRYGRHDRRSIERDTVHSCWSPLVQATISPIGFFVESAQESCERSCWPNSRVILRRFSDLVRNAYFDFSVHSRMYMPETAKAGEPTVNGSIRSASTLSSKECDKNASLVR